ncbi:RNA polymerase Rpb1, domain 1 [Nannocystis exedens]|uniref:RNA polymerase Rpb1, domain 1 n=1 Tax=Nannocystis exedens TaxID=54 RepID=A0A1I1ZIS6_9BACT|nr:DNA-directed RNA polymerase subunit beta' [Nannocystis exedens]SFE30463.1 RNA polymerase Rpb1, domain 1 [Nannocystis exedens]
MNAIASVDPPSALLFLRLRAVARLLGLGIVVDDGALVLGPEAAAAERSPSWSSGQVMVPETIDYRTGAPRPAGLLCASIFGEDLGRAGHVALPSPVVPRPARPLLTALLGSSDDELIDLSIADPDGLVARVERAEADGRTIQGWRPRQLVWWSLPVIAPGLRAKDQEEALRRDDEGWLSPRKLHDQYRRVLNQANRLRRLQELAAPQDLLETEHRALVRKIDQLLVNSEHDDPYLDDDSGIPHMDAVTLFFAALTPELVERSADGGWIARAARIAWEDAYAGRRLAALWELAGERPRAPLGPARSRVSATVPPAGDDSVLRARYESALRDTSDDALLGARALAGDLWRAQPGSRLHIDALVLLVRRALEDGEIDEALATADEAEALAQQLGDRARSMVATRQRGAALLRAGRVQEALAVLEPALRERGPLFGGSGAFRHVSLHDPRAAALDEAATVAGWATSTTPEWVRALGGIAERAGEGDDPEPLWMRFWAALVDMIAASPAPAADLLVVLRQARERGMSRTAEAAAQALEARRHLFVLDNLKTHHDPARVGRGAERDQGALEVPSGPRVTTTTWSRRAHPPVFPPPFHRLAATSRQGSPLALRLRSSHDARCGHIWLRVHENGDLEQTEGHSRCEFAVRPIAALGSADPRIVRALATRDFLRKRLTPQDLQTDPYWDKYFPVQAFAGDLPPIEGYVGIEVDMAMVTDIYGLDGDHETARRIVDSLGELLEFARD